MRSELLKAAQTYCETHKHRLTEPRLAVLKIIAASAKPLGAYEILEKLGKTIQDPKPPTAYRAIEFWQEHGFIHRIESLNAYTPCRTDHKHEGSQHLICQNCGKVIEVHICTLPESLENKAAENGFASSHWNVEIYGLCEQCTLI